ncbi:hypothetical protein SKAU_G00390940 [Synaphobranchus kaupii]|uniref:Uncharacterized protein n=1 Tax=Synaphobranchus kaupii TaxID=118154 RepID=A0A9Q1EBI9_SYNKA|nr:hypothetical protein SKAU_G00390940 [Synaphobranchus kaupii]
MGNLKQGQPVRCRELLTSGRMFKFTWTPGHAGRVSPVSRPALLGPEPAARNSQLSRGVNIQTGERIDFGTRHQV